MTKLLRLIPVGLGTPDVESLPSFIQRLSLIHGLGFHQMLGLIHEIYCDQNGIMPMLAPSYRNVASPTTLAGGSMVVEELVEELRAVINVGNLEYLTLVPVTSSLARDIQLTESMFKWCPACFRDDEAAGNCAYYRLLWHFRDLDKCPIHSIRLQNECPDCGQSQRRFVKHRPIGLCHVCEAPLKGDGVFQSLGESWRNDAFDIVEFLSGYNEFVPPEANGLQRILRALLVLHHQSGGKSDLFKWFERNEVMSVISGHTPVTFKTSRKFAYALGTPLDTVMHGDVSGLISNLPLRDHYAPNLLTRARRRRLNRNLAFQQLLKILNRGDDSLSLKQLAKDAGLSVGYIQYQFPGMAKAVILRRRAWLAQQIQDKRRLASELILERLEEARKTGGASKKRIVREVRQESGLSRRLLSECFESFH